jgi:hypothetical protein
MDSLMLHILPESPTVIKDADGDTVATLSVCGSVKVAASRLVAISRAVNSYAPLLEKLTLIYAELDRCEIEKAKRLASEAYYDAIHGEIPKIAAHVKG